MNKYESLYEIIQESLNNGEITLEEAEFLNDYAYDRYITEDGHSKKMKARHNAQKRNNEKKFYDNLNYKHDYTSKNGTKSGTISIDGDKEVPITIHNGKVSKGNGSKDSNYYAFYRKSFPGIHISRKRIGMKGSDLVGAHEYSHALDDNGKYSDELDNIGRTKSESFNKKQRQKIDQNSDKRDNELSKKDGIDRKFEIEKHKLKKEKNRSLNSHDRKSNEIRADVYAIKHLNKEHGANIMRKHLDESMRRKLQSDIGTDRSSFSSSGNKYVDAKEQLPHVKKLLEYYKKELSKLEKNKEKSKSIKNIDLYDDIYLEEDDKYYQKHKSELEKEIKCNEDKKKRLEEIIKNNKTDYENDREYQRKLNNQEIDKKRKLRDRQRKDRYDIANKLSK